MGNILALPMALGQDGERPPLSLTLVEILNTTGLSKNVIDCLDLRDLINLTQTCNLMHDAGFLTLSSITCAALLDGTVTLRYP